MRLCKYGSTIFYTGTLLLAGFNFSSVHAFEEEEINFKPAFGFHLGNHSYLVRLGAGYWKGNESHGQLYVSHFQTEDTLNNDGFRMKHQKYRSTRLGIHATSFKVGEAFEGGVFAYKNTSQARLDRVGLGISVAMGSMITDNTRALLGVELMPEYLSTGRDNRAFLEYSLLANVHYRLTSTIDLSVNYRYGGSVDRIQVEYYNQALLGIDCRF